MEAIFLIYRNHDIISLYNAVNYSLSFAEKNRFVLFTKGENHSIMRKINDQNGASSEPTVDYASFLSPSPVGDVVNISSVE